MRSLVALTVANIRSFVRDRAALFWTLAFPLIFVVLFGLIFSGPAITVKLAFVDLDNTAQSQQLEQAFASIKGVTVTTTDHDSAMSLMQTGKVSGVVEVPAGYGAAVTAASTSTSAPPATVTVYTDPSQSSQTAIVQQVVNAVLGEVNLGHLERLGEFLQHCCPDLHGRAPLSAAGSGQPYSGRALGASRRSLGRSCAYMA